MINFDKDIELKATDEQLGQVASLAQEQLQWQRRVDDLATQLAEAEARLRQISQELLPALMQNLGLTNLKLTTGERVDLKHVVKASINQANLAAALQWLRDNGHGSLIKNELIAAFGRADAKKAEQLYQELLKKGYNVNRRENVNANTLSAFVREQLTEGKKLPLDLLGAFDYYEVKIK